MRRSPMRKFAAALAAAATCCVFSVAADAQTVLKASHQFPGGKGDAFSATLMPALVRSHERAARLNDSPFMQEIKAKIDKAGVIVLSDAWLAGAVASKRGCILKPQDIKGLKIRSAGPTFAAMWQEEIGRASCRERLEDAVRAATAARL